MTQSATDSTRQVFSYRAVRVDGSMERGALEADDRKAAAGVLAARGLFPVALRATSGALGSGRAIPAAQLAFGLRLLADFLDAGLPLSRALAALEIVGPPDWKPVLPSVREAIRQGQSFAAALISSSRGFPHVLIGVIQAGEAGPGLASGVRQAAEIAEHAATVRTAIRNAIAYPALLAVSASVAIALLVGFVLPRFAEILGALGQRLPRSTQLVLDAASTARSVALPVVLLSALVVAAWHLWKSTRQGLVAWHEALLTLPVIGAIRRSAATARASAALAALLESGHPMPAALVLAGGAMADAALAARLSRARAAVIRGERLGRALEDAKAMSTVAEHLVRAGEETGRLALMLARCAQLERDRTVERTRQLVRLVEPTLIVLFGGLVAFVAAALLQALYAVRPGI